MLTADEVEPDIGHAIGGVCPFGINDGVKVYLDVSLKRFVTFFLPAAATTALLSLLRTSWSSTAPTVRAG